MGGAYLQVFGKEKHHLGVGVVLDAPIAAVKLGFKAMRGLAEPQLVARFTKVMRDWLETFLSRPDWAQHANLSEILTSPSRA